MSHASGVVVIVAVFFVLSFTTTGGIPTASAQQTDPVTTDVISSTSEHQRELSPLSDFLGRFEVCEKVGTNGHRTVRMSRIASMIAKMRGTATDGPCAECSTLCPHKACQVDYEVATKDGTETCTCLDEQSAKPMCGNHSTCSDDVCACNSGFTGIASVACVDVDECATSPCGTNAKCTNSDGTFQCKCMEGYTGDATSGCVDINECDSNSATKCGENTSCSNVNGTFECKCLEGYTGDPKVGCVDINECRSNTISTNCTDIPHAYCKNLPGSYECLCRKGYTKNPLTGNCISTSSCWGDGEVCSYGSTCNKCCNPATYWWDVEAYACGFNQPCWEDGKTCVPGITCGLCCNIAYENDGTACGGTCIEDGEECGYGTTCELCCDGSSWVSNKKSVCGKDDCWVNGTKCSHITGSCNQCCDEAFAKNGNECGGECWKEGKVCDDETTCQLCCDFSEFWPSKNSTACGKPPCLEDGIRCKDDNTCDNCCNGAYADGGKTCGGECLKKGKKCKPFETCNLCCGDYFSYIPETEGAVCGRGNFTECLEDDFECGELGVCWQCCNGPYEDENVCGGTCLANGTECTDFFTSDYTCENCCSGYSYDEKENKNYCGYESTCLEDKAECIPLVDCYNCCNGAYLDEGYKCGGECLEYGTDCVFGETCHLCCGETFFGYSSANFTYWYSRDGLACGTEECFEDGTPCIPGESCTRCCNGAYDKDGFACGGTCLQDGDVCELFSTCEKCCSGNFEYKEKKNVLKCTGFSSCLEDGESCVPYETCYNCCSGGAYGGNGYTCGGECIEPGEECNPFSTCNFCCSFPEYDEKEKKHICYDYNYDDDVYNNDDDWSGF